MKERQRQFNYSPFLLSEYNKILLLSLFSQVASAKYRALHISDKTND